MNVFPCDIRLARQVGPLEVAVTYAAGPRMRCTVQFSNVATQMSRSKPVSWLRQFIARDEASSLVPDADMAARPMLAYVQIIGYARLNHQIGSDGAGDPSQSAYWRDAEYSATYVADNSDDNVADILHTPFFAAPARGLAEHDVDKENYSLLRDLLHPYTAAQVPRDQDHVTEHHRAEIAASVARFVRPFYVLAQHLLFSSAQLQPGETSEYCMECDLPGDMFPPSYNTRLTGSLGDGGLALLAYAFVVGFQEEVNGEMRQRAIYFPLELRTTNVDACTQHTYLQAVHIDTSWRPQPVGTAPADDSDGDIAYATFLADLNLLLNDTTENVAARERRKSSVSLDKKQVTQPLRTSYQIRVNSQDLCLLTLSSGLHRVGTDVQFCLAPADKRDIEPQMSRIVGYTAHLEAHEIFHLPKERKVVNVYKVSPTLKANAFAEAMQDRAALHNLVHVPSHVTPQLRAPALMDLRYFLVFRFVLGDVDVQDTCHVQDTDGSEFKFSVPIAIVP